MTEDEQPPKLSPLAQTVTRDGKTVRVDIYEDGEGGWLLEVVDEYWNSTVWDEPFACDRAALDEALKTIDAVNNSDDTSAFGNRCMQIVRILISHSSRDAELAARQAFLDFNKHGGIAVGGRNHGDDACGAGFPP
ncbi:MAG: hypothetical protein ACREXW_04955 [Gammaproteobacteria bacterium]